MRKIIAIALCLLMLLSIVACNNNDDTTTTDADTSAVSTENTTPATSDTEAEGQVGTGEWTKLY